MASRKRPEMRIVSLAPSATSILCAIGARRLLAIALRLLSLALRVPMSSGAAVLRLSVPAMLRLLRRAALRLTLALRLALNCSGSRPLKRISG